MREFCIYKICKKVANKLCGHSDVLLLVLLVYVLIVVFIIRGENLAYCLMVEASEELLYGVEVDSLVIYEAVFIILEDEIGVSCLFIRRGREERVQSQSEAVLQHLGDDTSQ